MSADAKLVAIRWRRILFGFHLLVWLIARLAVGSMSEMPPHAIYVGLSLWGFVVLAHGALLAILDGRDRAELPFAWMTALIQPRERRWSLLVIDAALWILFTTAIASRVIPEYLIFQYVAPLALVWLAQTGFALFHVLLMLYAEIFDRTVTKRKNDDKAKPIPVMLSDDGELVDFVEAPQQKIKHD